MQIPILPGMHYPIDKNLQNIWDLLFCFLFAAVRLSLDADYLTDSIQGDILKYKAYRLQAQVYM